ncbi:restriction endonuclease subunit S [Amycolatopsis sp. SB7-3]|uniref:restriction endonuclease subunit S n=1 Tax=Amycolatopsis sp. SB7-3 TaxID=3373438 RepID=UPI0037425F83
MTAHATPWPEATLGEISTKVTVGFVGSMSHLFRARGVPLLRGTNVLPGRIDLTNLRYISHLTHKSWSKSALQPGDLVLVRVGYPGRTAIVPDSLKEANAASLVIVRPDRRFLNPSFAMHVLNSRLGSARIEEQLVGGAQQVFNTGLAAKLQIPLPPRSEQDRIAVVLDDIDELIATLERMIVKKQAIKQGVVQKLLTGETRLPGFSTPWSRVCLRDAGSTYGGLAGKTKDDFGTGSASFVTFTEVMESPRLHGRRLERVKVLANERQNSVRRGDVLFNGSSETPEEVALAAVVDFNPSPTTFLNSFCFGYRLKQYELIDPGYLAYFFRSGSGRALVASLAQGATRYNIAKTKVLNLSLLLPPIDEQRAIVAAFQDSENEIMAIKRRLAKKRNVKQGIMQQLLTGRTRLPIEEGAA